MKKIIFAILSLAILAGCTTTLTQAELDASHGREDQRARIEESKRALSGF